MDTSQSMPENSFDFYHPGKMDYSMSSETVRPAHLRKILFVTNTLGYGGSEKHLLELICRLDDSSVRAVILCAKTDPYTERLKERNGAKVRVQSETGLESVFDWMRVFRKIRPDEIVFVYGTLVDLPWYASVAGRLAGVTRIYAIQHLIPPPPPAEVKGNSIRDLVRRLVGRRARYMLSSRVPPHLFRKTICVSDAVRSSLTRDYGFPPKKMVTIHNGVPPTMSVPAENSGNLIRQKFSISPEDFLLVCTARLSWEKGVDILLQSMSRLAPKDPSCKCIILGEGYLKDELLEQLRALGLTHSVFMAGFQEDVTPYLLAADAFVLTSLKEGLPFAVLEAMSCGLPCVVTNVGGNAEAVIHNINGLVVNAGSVEEVVEAVSYLISHPQERARMAQMSRSRARAEFDIEAKMAEIKHVIFN